MATNEHDHETERVREGQGPTKDKLRRVLDEAARDDEDRTAQQRNAGLAILVLAVVVVVLLLAIVSGATDAFQP
jgi:hypothetical protein